MDRIAQILRTITVEPVLFLYMLATWLQFPTMQGLYFHKLCMVRYNDSIFCDTEIDNGSYKTQERLVHADTSHWMFYDTLCIALPSLVMAPYFGSWSDKLSRKIPLILPPIGAVLGCVNYIISSLYIDLPVSLILISPLLNGLCGGFITTILAVFSYIGAVSDKENRNIRVSILESMSFLGGTVGLGLSGLLLSHYGFIVLFSVMLVIQVVIILYVILVVPSVPVPPREEGTNLCVYLFSLVHIKNYVVCVFKPREHNNRRNLLMIIFSLFLVFMCFAGTRDISYLYLKKSPLSWTRDMYGYFQAYQNSIFFLLLVVGTPVLKKLVKLSDPIMILFGLSSTTLSLLMFGFSTRTWMVFMVPLIGMFHGHAAASSRALASQFVTKDEQGKLFAFIGSSETISSLLASAIFNSLYPASLSFFAGLSFIVMAGILCISLSLVVFVYCMMTGSDYPYIGFEDGLTVAESGQGQLEEDDSTRT